MDRRTRTMCHCRVGFREMRDHALNVAARVRIPLGLPRNSLFRVTLVPQPDINPPSSAEVARLLRRAAETSPELSCFLMLRLRLGRGGPRSSRCDGVTSIYPTSPWPSAVTWSLARTAWSRRTHEVSRGPSGSARRERCCRACRPLQPTCRPTPRPAGSCLPTRRACSATPWTVRSPGTRTRCHAASTIGQAGGADRRSPPMICVISSRCGCSAQVLTFAPSQAARPPQRCDNSQRLRPLLHQ